MPAKKITTPCEGAFAISSVAAVINASGRNATMPMSESGMKCVEKILNVRLSIEPTVGRSLEKIAASIGYGLQFASLKEARRTLCRQGDGRGAFPRWSDTLVHR